MKNKYESNQKLFKNKSSNLENMDTEFNKKQEEKHQLLEKCYQHVLTLEENALCHLDYLVGKMTDQRDEEKIPSPHAMKSRVEQGERS